MWRSFEGFSSFWEEISAFWGGTRPSWPCRGWVDRGVATGGWNEPHIQLPVTCQPGKGTGFQFPSLHSAGVPRGSQCGTSTHGCCLHGLPLEAERVEGAEHPTPLSQCCPGPPDLAGTIIFPISGFPVPSVKSQLNYFPPSLNNPVQAGTEHRGPISV